MKTYLIKDVSEVGAQHYAASIGEESTQRKSLNGAQVLLKFSGTTPDVFQGETLYTQDEVWEILGGPAWTRDLL